MNENINLKYPQNKGITLKTQSKTTGLDNSTKAHSKEEKREDEAIKKEVVRQDSPVPKPPKLSLESETKKDLKTPLEKGKKPLRKRQSKVRKTYILDQFYKPLPFLKRINSKKYLALDIDADKIRYLVVNKSVNSIQVKRWGVQKFPAEEANRFKALQIALENVRARIYKSGMEVHACIFSPDINIRQIILPKMRKKSDLESAIFYKNQTDLQNFDETSIWSYEILQEFEADEIKKLRVLVVVVPSETVNKYLTVFKNTKFNMTNLVPRPAALQASYMKMIPRDKKDLIIDISYDFTQICYLKYGRLEYIRNVGIGSRNLEVIIRDVNKIVNSAGADIKVPGMDSSEGKNHDANILRQRLLNKVKDLQSKQNPVLHTFFSEILRSLAFIQGKRKDEFVDRIFVTGYGIRKENLIPYLRNRLNMSIFVLAPQFSSGERKSLDYGEFVTTLGTLLQNNKTFNLLPAKYRNRLLFRKLNWLLVIIFILSGACIEYFSFSNNKFIKDQQKLIVQYQQEYEKLNTVEGKYQKLNNKVIKVIKESQELQSYVKTSPRLLEVLRLFSLETSEEIQLQSLNFQDVSTSTEENGEIVTPINDYQFQVEITGVIKGDLLMADVILINFINRLKGLKYFKNIELISKQKIAEENVTNFGIKISF